jgi:hypothetical protein
MPYNASPQILSGPWPRMVESSRARAERALREGCNCGSRTATFKKRVIGAAITVWLQCDGCGRAYNNSYKRADHFNWQDYPVWDDTLRDRYNEKYQQEAAERYRDAGLARRQRSIEYNEWCRTSPEWHDLVEKIIWRSRGHCEACLAGKAVTVHHVTYEFGKLPPAWHLRAVCLACHDRLHTEGDNWCGFGMARGA